MVASARDGTARQDTSQAAKPGFEFELGNFRGVDKSRQALEVRFRIDHARVAGGRRAHSIFIEPRKYVRPVEIGRAHV